ncbi:hypothetical protein HY031_00890, partial [Candidatus Gottesmanbacteria bacterium]|nr:hypothetical protein [Candidatus Gottesmanbacteria bacterium]
MFKLRYGYFISGITIGCILLFSFLWSLPDGKLHIVFCNVGQGDAAYIRLPDGRDMLIDGGPDDKVLGCLGKHMPFWDRDLDLAVLSHPQSDHMEGFVSVLERYRVGYFVRSDITNTSEGYQKLHELIQQKKIAEKLVTSGDQVTIGKTSFAIIWPSDNQIALMHRQKNTITDRQGKNVLGSQSQANLNDGSVVLWLRYGSFDALFPGDADNHVNRQFTGTPLADETVEVLKVPHHGSKTGMTESFVTWLKPKLAIISVGKNSYGHPSKEAMNLLSSVGSRILRTDQKGDIEVVSDGKNW